MFILIGPHVNAFSDENQTVCPTLKNKTTWIIYKKNLLLGISKKGFAKIKIFYCFKLFVKSDNSCFLLKIINTPIFYWYQR
jgi:hypothetical protein